MQAVAQPIRSGSSSSWDSADWSLPTPCTQSFLVHQYPINNAACAHARTHKHALAFTHASINTGTQTQIRKHQHTLQSTQTCCNLERTWVDGVGTKFEQEGSIPNGCCIKAREMTYYSVT